MLKRKARSTKGRWGQTSEEIMADINKQKRLEERGSKESRSKLAAVLKKQRKERDAQNKLEAKRQKEAEQRQRNIEVYKSKTEERKAIAEFREQSHRARQAHPLVKVFHKDKPKSPFALPKRRKKSKLLGRGSGWSL
jgi:uncharacterized protein YqfA (UPF0365 family)